MKNVRFGPTDAMREDWAKETAESTAAVAKSAMRDFLSGRQQPVGATMGWQCPVCKKVHAPTVPACDCHTETLGDRLRRANRKAVKLS